MMTARPDARAHARAVHRASSCVLALAGALALVAGGCRALLEVDELPATPMDGGALDGEAQAATDSCSVLDPPPTFCANFDRGELLDQWENARVTPDLLQSGGGLIEPETLAFRSAPRAAAVSLPPLLDDAQTASAVLSKVFHTPFRTLAVQFDMRVETEYFPSASSGVVPIAGITYGRRDAAMASAITLIRGKSGVQIGAFDPKDMAYTHLGLPIQVGTWKTIALLLDFRRTSTEDGGTRGDLLHVTVDGEDAAELPLPPSFRDKAPSVWIGPFAASGPSGPFRAQIDDVRIYAR